MTGTLGRDFYDALVTAAVDELATLRDSDEPALARLGIDGVSAEHSDEHGDHIVVLFHDPERPGCRFGWRWSWAEDPQPGELEFAAQMLRVNLEEDVLSERYGLPADCAGDGVTWF